MSYRFKAFRYWLKARLLWLALPIRSGPLRGCRWSVFTGSRFVLGRYHEDETAEIQRLVRPGDVVYDIGAHVGYYTLVAARAAGPAGHVHAFEPLPLNQRTLQGHLRMNRIDNVSLLTCAVSDAPGVLRFDPAGGTGRGRLSTRGTLEVPVVRIDDLVEQGLLRPPALIKMDIEGAEAAALRGALRTLREHAPVVFVATHGDAVRRECEQLLHSLGYRVREFRHADLIAER